MGRLSSGVSSYTRGRKWPAAFLLALPFITLMAPMYEAARRRVDWVACMLMVLSFEVIMFVAEHNSIMRGHWVYNESRILGPRIWGIPIEEPLIYYFFPPVFVVLLYETMVKLLEGSWGKGKRRRN